MTLRKFSDKFMAKFNAVVGISNIVIVFLIFIFIFSNGINFFKDYSAKDFLTGTEWISLSGKYGLLPLLVGSLWTTGIALAIAI
ncbi:MAG: phosphate ABC transporter permease subunit PstC, partial [Fusobacteriaceae bacterium]